MIMASIYIEKSDILTVEDMAELMGGARSAQSCGRRSIEEEEVPL